MKTRGSFLLPYASSWGMFGTHVHVTCCAQVVDMYMIHKKNVDGLKVQGLLHIYMQHCYTDENILLHSTDCSKSRDNFNIGLHHCSTDVDMLHNRLFQIQGLMLSAPSCTHDVQQCRVFQSQVYCTYICISASLVYTCRTTCRLFQSHVYCTLIYITASQVSTHC
jgi:hypothetical protein